MLGEAARLMRAALDGNGRQARRLQARRPPVPALRRTDPLARPGRRQPHRLLVPRLPKRRGAAGRVEATRGRARPAPLPLPAPASVWRASRCSRTTSQAGTSSRSRSRSTPRAGRARSTSTGRSPARYVEARAERLSALADARLAIEDLGREPAAAIYAAAHSGKAGDQPLLRTIVLPLLADVAEACGGFDWSDEAFDRAYVELERSLLGERRTYAAVAPLVGLSVGTQVELADGLRIRVAAAGELAAHWPEANGLLPAGFGTRARPALRARARARRCCPTSRARPTRRASSPTRSARCAWRPQRPSRRARCCSSGSTGGRWRSVRCCRSRRPSRPGEPTRLDAFRARLASDLLARLGRAEEDPELAEALDRWELSLFADEPFRSEQLREALAALLGGPDGLWAASVRAAVLLGETASRPRRRSSSACAGSRGARRPVPGPPTRCARRSSRRSPTATAQASSPRSTTRSSASGRARPATSLRSPPRASSNRLEPPRRGSTVVPGHGVACESVAPRASRAGRTRW